ncbi:MAG: hypothetical protein ACT4P6_15805 [Gemmatimonadaceae bacterium]
MSLLTTVPLLGLSALFFAGQAHAQDTALTRLLIANRHPLRVSDGRLEGSGGRLLVDEGKQARFFLVGEEHGVAELPAVVQALLKRATSSGL